MTGADVLAALQSVASRLGDALPVLLGGAGGAVLIWWLDGRREQRRDRRRLAGALQVVGFEMSGNVAMADLWASLPDRLKAGESIESLEAGPIEMRAAAWERNEDEMARQLPRELVSHIGLAYGLARMFARNVAVAQKRGHLVENDIRLAIRVRDNMRAALRESQGYEERALRVKFPDRPIDAPEASKGAE